MLMLVFCFTGLIRALAYVRNNMKSAFIVSRLKPFLEQVCSECSYPEIQQLFGLQSSMVACWSLSQLRYYDSALFDFLVNRFVHSAQTGIRFQPEHILVLLESLARSNHKSTRFEEFVNRWLFDQMHALSTKQILQAMWAVSMLDCQEPDILDALCSQLLAREDWTGMDWSKVAQVLHHAKHMDGPEEYRVDLLRQAEEELKEWPLAQSSPGPSRAFNSKVQSALTNLSVQFDTDFVVEHPWLVAPTVVKRGPLAIEVSCVQDHAISEGFELLGPSHFRDRLLQRSGYKVQSGGVQL